MRNTPDVLSSILTGGQPKSERQSAPTQPQEGRIIAVGETTATFVLPDYDSSKLYGPAPFTKAGSSPQPGDKCLVVFVGNGVDRAWITAWNVES